MSLQLDTTGVEILKRRLALIRYPFVVGTKDLECDYITLYVLPSLWSLI
jgi:hypothetical protein